MPSKSRARYFLTVIDDYNGTTWIYLLKNKYDTSTFLIDFCNMISTQFNKKIKRIRSDNGGEFVSNITTNFYEEHGILLETSCVHTPQQKRVVERKHRHLLEIARALRFQANLAIKF